MKYTFDGKVMASRRCALDVDPWPFKGIASIFPLNATGSFEILMIAWRRCSSEDKRKAQSLFYSASSGDIFWLNRRHVNKSVGRAWFQWNDVLYVARYGQEKAGYAHRVESSVLNGPDPDYNYELDDVGPRSVAMNFQRRVMLNKDGYLDRWHLSSFSSFADLLNI